MIRNGRSHGSEMIVFLYILMGLACMSFVLTGLVVERYWGFENGLFVGFACCLIGYTTLFLWLDGSGEAGIEFLLLTSPTTAVVLSLLFGHWLGGLIGGAIALCAGFILPGIVFEILMRPVQAIRRLKRTINRKYGRTKSESEE